MSEVQKDDILAHRVSVVPTWLVRGLEGITALSIFAIMLLIFIDVIMRYFFNHPIRGALEVVGMFMALLTMSALPLVTEERNHITIDLIDGLLHGAIRYTIQFVILIFQMIMIGFISWRIYMIADREWHNGWVTVDLEISRAPLLFGMAFFGALTTAIVMWMIIQFARGRLPVMPIGGLNTGSDEL